MTLLVSRKAATKRSGGKCMWFANRQCRGDTIVAIPCPPGLLSIPIVVALSPFTPLSQKLVDQTEFVRKGRFVGEYTAQVQPDNSTKLLELLVYPFVRPTA